MPTAFLCDFDGTVSPRDIGAGLVRAYTTGREREVESLLERWSAGGMGHRELTEAECALLTVHEHEALGFALGHALDPAFAPFVAEAAARGDAVMVVSEGFDFYVNALLEREGLGGLERAANHLGFAADGRVHPDFPFHDPACPGCGNCKGRHVRDWRSRGYRTVLVGDGMSDRCGARAADHVLARGALLAWCRREGIAARPFQDFRDVAALARVASSHRPDLS
ncbi:MAG: HAD-IB family phosphatase [Candidatus Eisenbacteria bacterium]